MCQAMNIMLSYSYNYLTNNIYSATFRRKVTKEKATLNEMLRTFKEAIRCLRKALFNCMVLVFLPIVYCYPAKE